MVLAKSDTQNSSKYDELLVEDPGQKMFGWMLRKALVQTIYLLIKVSGEHKLLNEDGVQ